MLDWQEIGTELVVTIMGLLFAAAAPLVTAGFMYLRQKYTWLKQTTVDEQLEKNILDAIHEAEATRVRELKAAKADGKLTDEEGKLIKQEVATAVINNLTSTQKKIIETMTNDITTFVVGKVQRIFDQDKLKQRVDQAVDP